jgi:hypothetical protein
VSDSRAIAATILEQLGGRRFLAMTGARDLLAIDGGLQFKFPNRSPAPNCCKIILTPADLYDVTFYRLRGFDANVTATAEGLYFDQLQEVFTRETGLDTHL